MTRAATTDAASDTARENVTPIDVCGKRTRNYLLECLGRLNREAAPGHLKLRAIGGNISKGVGLAQILVRELDCHIRDVEIHPLVVEGERSSCIEIDLEGPASLRSDESVGDALESIVVDGNFVSYPAYNVLFDALLMETGPLEVQVEVQIEDRKAFRTVCEVSATPSSYACKWTESIASSPKKVDGPDGRPPDDRPDPRQEVLRGLTEAYYRCGFILSPHWNTVAKSLSRFDDIILCADTNILNRAVLTSQLLNSLTLIDPREYTHTPNWIFIVVPNAVIHELEQTANVRRRSGLLNRHGRIGYRALQEVLEINNSLDLSGVSLTVVGTANPALDTKEELRGLRRDLAGQAGAYRSPKGSSGDMIIRAQFKEFVRQLDFHKGVFFLTADKSCAALARAEGLHPIYYQNPPSATSRAETLTPARVKCESHSGDITLCVPLGALFYELAVQFGAIKLKWSDAGKSKSTTVEIDQKGESLDPWIHRHLRIWPLSDLVDVYRRQDRLPLSKVGSIAEQVIERLLDTEI